PTGRAAQGPQARPAPRRSSTWRVLGSASARDARRTGPARSRHLDDVTRDELTAAARVGLTVDAHLAVGDEVARLCAGLGKVGQLEELAQADGLVADRHVMHRLILAGVRAWHGRAASFA